MVHTMSFDLTQKLIGVKRPQAFKVTNAAGVVVNGVTRTIDYSNLTLADVLDLADAAIVIKIQRTLRSKTEAQITEGNGMVVMAEDAGKTPETPETLVAKLKAMGLSAEQIAAMMTN